MITIATFTGRPEPRLGLMAQYLAIAEGSCKERPAHEWLIIDEMLGSRWSPSGLDFHISDLNVRLTKPPQSNFRGDHLCWDQWRPDHPNGFNTAIRHARGDYLVILNDCQIVSRHWFAVAMQMRKRGVGWGCKVTSTETLEGYTFPAEYDRIEEIPPENACGPCWGAPLAYFRKVRGFDGIYSGQYKYQDFDCAVRMHRAGLRFESTRKAWACTLTKGRSRKDISPFAHEPPERNRRYFEDLIKDKERITPILDVLDAN